MTERVDSRIVKLARRQWTRFGKTSRHEYLATIGTDRDNGHGSSGARAFHAWSRDGEAIRKRIIQLSYMDGSATASLSAHNENLSPSRFIRICRGRRTIRATPAASATTVPIAPFQSNRSSRSALISLLGATLIRLTPLIVSKKVLVPRPADGPIPEDVGVHGATYHKRSGIQQSASRRHHNHHA